MKPDLSDPPRLADDGAGRLAELLRAERLRGPSDDAARRLAQGIAPSKLAERAARARGVHVGASASVLAGGAAIVLASLALLSWRSSEPAASSTASPPEPVAVAATAPVPLQTSREGAAESVTVDIPTLDVDALPTRADVSPAAEERRRAAPKTRSGQGTASASQSRGPTELELLLQARGSLASDPARSLEIAGAHASAYPDGQFAQEREVIVVEALARLGRRDEARTRAASFVSRYPKTPYSARIELAVGPL